MVGVLGEGDVQAGKHERTAMAVLRRTEFTTAAVREARPRCSHVLRPLFNIYLEKAVHG